MPKPCIPIFTSFTFEETIGFTLTNPITLNSRLYHTWCKDCGEDLVCIVLNDAPIETQTCNTCKQINNGQLRIHDYQDDPEMLEMIWRRISIRIAHRASCTIC